MTKLYFQDFVASSPSRRLELEVSSPDNADPRRSELGFQGGFTFRLVRSEDRHEIWTAPPGQSRDPSPCEAWVSNEGWSVVRTYGYPSARLLVLNPSGARALRVNIRHEPGDGLDGDDGPSADWVDAHCQVSRAGLIWSIDSLSYFFEVDGQPWFCMRTGWGRRLAIDLEDGLRRLPPRPAARLAGDDEISNPAWIQAASNAERAVVREILTQRSSPLLPAALAIVGDDRLVDMLPLLIDLAAIEDDAMSTTSYAVPSWSLVRNRLRTQLRWALRRLGAAPSLATGLSFRATNGGDPAVPGGAACVERPPVRARKLLELRAPWDVLEHLGFPDHVRSGNERSAAKSSPTSWWEDWEYDVTDGADAWTVRIRWSTPTHGQVATMLDVRDTEPGWQGRERRGELFGRP